MGQFLEIWVSHERLKECVNGPVPDCDILFGLRRRIAQKLVLVGIERCDLIVATNLSYIKIVLVCNCRIVLVCCRVAG